MSHHRSLLWVPIGLGILMSGSARPSGAQIPYPVLAMSVRADSPSNTCDNAPLPCRGAQWAPTTGRYEFDMYRTDQWSGGVTNAARFCLHWPATWTFVGAELCVGSLVSGELGVPYSPLEFVFPDCPPADAPFLRIWFECPTPGALVAGCDPSVRSCSYGNWEPEYMRLWCDVGDYCGRLPFAPCDWCSMQNDVAASFDPRSLEVSLPPGAIWSGHLSLWGWSGCPGAPECGYGYGDCFNGLTTDVPWLRTTIPSAPAGIRGNVDYNLRIDTAGLSPGQHVGNVVSVPGCFDCYESCMTVTLTVQDPATAEDGSMHDYVRLDGPYPNPAADRFDYAITMPVQARASVVLFDMAGRRAAVLFDGELPAGMSELSWDQAGAMIPAGAYVMRLDAGGVRRSRLVVLAH